MVQMRGTQLPLTSQWSVHSIEASLKRFYQVVLREMRGSLESTFQGFGEERKEGHRLVVLDVGGVKGGFLEERLDAVLKTVGNRPNLIEVLTWVVRKGRMSPEMYWGMEKGIESKAEGGGMV